MGQPRPTGAGLTRHGSLCYSVCVSKTSMETVSLRNNFERVHPGWHLLGLVFVLAWLCVMWFMFRTSPVATGAVKLAPLGLGDSLADFEVWMGAYYKNRRLGSVHASLSGRDFEQDSRLAFVVGGSRQRIQSRLGIRLDGEGSFASFNLNMESDLLSIEIMGRLEKHERSPSVEVPYYDLSLSIDLGSEKIHKNIKLAKAPMFDFALPRLLAAQDLTPGRRYQVTLFDPQSFSNKEAVIEVLGPEAKKTSNGLLPAIHLRRNTGGLVLDSWIDESGNVIAEQTALGLELRREEPGVRQTEALPVIDQAQDLSGLMRIPALRLPQPGKEGRRP